MMADPRSILAVLIAMLVAYILGSIPTAVWVGKAFYGKDVREHGSGNAGATNTFRVLGGKAAIPVLLFDVFKGWAPVYFLAPWVIKGESADPVIFQLLIGAAALLGHIFPVFARFKGGKGIATSLGIVLAIHFYAAISCLGIFILVFGITRFVSLGSMIAAICFPLFLWIIFHEKSSVLLIFSFIFAGLIIWTHRANIGRLLKGNENKIIFGKDESG